LRWAASIASSVLGTLPLALLVAGAWARFAPLAEATRFVLALLLVIPVWLAFILVASSVRRSGWWTGACLALSVGLAFFLR
jgi:hypothetical protein